MQAQRSMAPVGFDNSHLIDLDARQLWCERDDRVLFEHLDLKVGHGEIIQLAGPNGAGKTTLLRLLAGLNQDYRGCLMWHNKPLRQVYYEYARQRLYIGHRSALKPSMTALENLTWLTAGFELTTEQLEQALADVDLMGFEHTLCAQLSAGQQRRVALSKLIALPCPLWILDEPFTALDHQGVTWLEQRMQQHTESGGSVIITSHHGLDHISSIRRLQLEDYAGLGFDEAEWDEETS